MLQTSSLASKNSWNSEVYSNNFVYFSLCIFIFRLVLTILQRNFYSNPLLIVSFTALKVLVDYLIFEGVERFSFLSNSQNLKIILIAEVIFQILQNFMIQSIFYSDFFVNFSTIFRFFIRNLVLFFLSLILILISGSDYILLAAILLVHLFSYLFFVEKCASLLSTNLYQSIAKTFFYLTMIFKLLFDHVLRLTFITSLILEINNPTQTLDRILFITQNISTIIILFYFTMYRIKNSKRINTAFGSTESCKKPTEEPLKRIESPKTFIFENRPEEFMCPAEADRSTMSSLDEVEVMSVVEMDVEQVRRVATPEIRQIETITENVPYFHQTTPDPPPPKDSQKRSERRVRIIAKGLNRIGSEDSSKRSN